ncbi:MAG TPA: dTDP-4-dehydrorhamnose reductase [Solirubrobacteraceae bacterium]|nr:dTDP-4-dehydrorhamnose reductase [Solirubrobacteraceae bacterium]
MRILITGAAGMLGHDVRTAAQAAGHEPILLARAELDVTEADAVREAILAARPDAVINCAAWTDVDRAEGEEAAARAVNGTGAGNVAAAAHASGAFIVHVSTDYVFAGDKRAPYLESDAVAPAGAYGRTKLAGERAVAQAAPDRHTVVRTAWLFGAAGRCFPETILRVARERGELSVVDDQVGSPTYTGHLAPALVALASGALPGLVHVAADGECSWYEFAVAIVNTAGVACEVAPCRTTEFPRPAPRPAYSVLRSERGDAVPRLPHWRDGLAAYLTTTKEASA